MTFRQFYQKAAYVIAVKLVKKMITKIDADALASSVISKISAKVALIPEKIKAWAETENDSDKDFIKILKEAVSEALDLIDTDEEDSEDNWLVDWLKENLASWIEDLKSLATDSVDEATEELAEAVSEIDSE